jgi:hypothetical protein
VIDLEQLLQALMKGGKVKIEIYITLDKPAIDRPYTAVCERCGWSWPYKHKSSAHRAIRSHATHCRGKNPGSRFVQNSSER